MLEFLICILMVIITFISTRKIYKVDINRVKSDALRDYGESIDRDEFLFDESDKVLINLIAKQLIWGRKFDGQYIAITVEHRREQIKDSNAP